MAKIPPRKRKTARASLRAICNRLGLKLSVGLCRMGSHDWRHMDGYCCQCGARDDMQFETHHPAKPGEERGG